VLALNRILGQKLLRARLFPGTVQAQGVVPDHEACRPNRDPICSNIKRERKAVFSMSRDCQGYTRSEKAWHSIDKPVARAAHIFQ
jgi:hypothetical protein